MIKNPRIKEWYSKNKDHKKNEITKILGVEYAHLILENKDDIYITKHGFPYIDNLNPKNFFTDKKWFSENSVRLSGTSCLYKIRTKKVNGRYIDIVIKWNRMGQDVPGLDDSEELMHAEFNSPFEEFSLVMDLRAAMDKVYAEGFIQKPLAIYVPSKQVELWQSGRKEYQMKSKIKSHKEIRLDMFRSYVVIYEWIPGVDATQACRENILNEKEMKLLTIDSEESIKNKGFMVRDRKPHHIIVRPNNNDIVRDKNGRGIYSLVDFELLTRTQEKMEMVRKSKRADYLKRERDRFQIDIPNKFHPHLSHVSIFGVDYVYGHVESTKGRLWVVGKDPYLFDFFLPERWEQTPNTKLSMLHKTYYTVTKDNIHLVWKVSKVGQKPVNISEKKIIEYGYDSPFEEVAAAVELMRKGIATIYPRAIYMAGNNTKIPKNILDNNRYESHKDIITSDGVPILKKNHNYIIIWGYWNGPDEKLAAKDGDYYEGINASHALKEGIITPEQYRILFQASKEKLLKAGFEDLNFKGNHLLISLDSKGNLIKNKQGMIETRICNFEFIKKIKNI